MTTLAIDADGTKLAAVLAGADGQIRDHRELPMPASQTPQALCDALSALVFLSQARAQRVAIAPTGIIRDGSLLALNPHNLGGLLHFPLVKTLKQLTNLSTIAINDAQAVVWTEYQALDDDITDMVFITVSTGIGGDVMSGGRLRIGPGGLTGHIGHTLIDLHGPVCSCGRTGCVEAIVSGHGTATAAQGELAGVNAETIFTRVGQGDEQAQQLIRHPARTFARLIIGIKAITDCQYVMIGDSVGLAGGYLVPMETYPAQEPVAFHADLLATRYCHDVGLLGIALLIQEEIL